MKQIEANQNAKIVSGRNVNEKTPSLENGLHRFREFRHYLCLYTVMMYVRTSGVIASSYNLFLIYAIIYWSSLLQNLLLIC